MSTSGTSSTPPAGAPARDAYAPGLPFDPHWPRAGSWLRRETADHADGPLDLALLGVPAWRTSLSQTGADQTPDAVRAALLRYSTHGHDLELDGLVVADLGDVADPDFEEGEQRTYAAVLAAAARARLVVALGGDNSITLPVALGAFGGSLGTAGLITLDAHYDLRDGVSNGSPVRRLLASGLDGSRVVQVGISDFANSRFYADRARAAGITVITRDDVERRGIDECVAEALDVAGAAGGPVHVDLDVDVCDRAVAPGCPASVPGGISAYELRRAAYLLAADHRVGSLDLAEVDATADAPDGRTVRLAALCVLEAAAGLASRA
ncbi:MAG: arginase family protein [Candidatus Nanopelagicales bacterium]